MRTLRTILVIVCLIALALAPGLKALAQTEAPQMTITQAGFLTPGVPEVTAKVSVIALKADSSGAVVSGLTPSEFEVSEDNRPIPPADLAVSEEVTGLVTVLVLDTGANVTTQRGVTSSTRWGDLHDFSDDRGKNGLVSELVKQRLNQPEDWIGFVGVGKEVAPIVALDRDQNKVLNAVTDMQPYRGVTPLRAGIDQALKLLESPDLPANARKNIVVFSDGIDVTKSPDEFADLIRRAVASGVTFYTVGMASPNSQAGYDSTGLERLAKQTGGAFVQHGSQDQRAQVLAMFDRIVTQRQQYRLTYQTHAAQGQHELRIRAKTPDGMIESATNFVSPLQMPNLEIAASADSVVKPGAVTITPAWKVTDGFARDPARIEYLVNGKVISTVTDLVPFVWDTGSLPNEDAEYALEARGYDSILRDAPPATSNQRIVKVSIPVTTQAVQSVGQNWLGLLLLPVVILLLIIVIPNRKKITQTARATTQKLQVATRRLTPSSSARFKLMALSLGQEFPLTEKIVRIGRDPSCSIALSDLSVSLAHADLTEDQSGNYMIADLTSTNGTFVNGQRLQAGPGSGQAGSPVMLRPGDLIRIGSVELRFDYAKVTRRLPPGS